MPTPAFRLERHGLTATLTLSQPDRRNALGADFWDAFPAAIAALDATGEVRALILAAEGPHFCAGIDLNMFAGIAAERAHFGAAAGADFLLRVKRLQQAFNALEEARFPVVAAIQGGCIGAGVDMVTACDIRLCTDDAYFSVYEINVGMTADVGTFPRLLNHLPEGIVRELSYTGRKMPSAEAASRGLVNASLPDVASLMARARALADEIANKAPLAIAGCKRIITYARDHDTADTLDYVGVWNASMLQPSEVMAAIGASRSKAPANFAPLPPAPPLWAEAPAPGAEATEPPA